LLMKVPKAHHLPKTASSGQWKPSGKNQWCQSETSWGARRPHDTYGSSSDFRDPNKYSLLSKRPVYGEH
jgi:hypothetical protein